MIKVKIADIEITFDKYGDFKKFAFSISHLWNEPAIISSPRFSIETDGNSIFSEMPEPNITLTTTTTRGKNGDHKS